MIYIYFKAHVLIFLALRPPFLSAVMGASRVLVKCNKHGSTKLSLRGILIDLCMSSPAEVEMRKWFFKRDCLKEKLHPLASCFEQQKS